MLSSEYNESVLKPLRSWGGPVWPRGEGGEL